MVKCALLIDGGYFLKRLPTVQPDIDHGNPAAVAESMEQLTREGLNKTFPSAGHGCPAKIDGASR